MRKQIYWNQISAEHRPRGAVRLTGGREGRGAMEGPLDYRTPADHDPKTEASPKQELRPGGTAE